MSGIGPRLSQGEAVCGVRIQQVLEDTRDTYYCSMHTAVK